MDELSSTEFRKSFARLTKPTVVTVNGHVMGQWLPYGGPEREAWTLVSEPLCRTRVAA